jgi:hypothetical protein
VTNPRDPPRCVRAALWWHDCLFSKCFISQHDREFIAHHDPKLCNRPALSQLFDCQRFEEQLTTTTLHHTSNILVSANTNKLIIPPQSSVSGTGLAKPAKVSILLVYLTLPLPSQPRSVRFQSGLRFRLAGALGGLRQMWQVANTPEE